MVKDPNTIWIGLEYFCNTTDLLWQLPDDDIKDLAIKELEKMGLSNSNNFLDSTVIRVEKTFPSYFGTFHQFDQIRKYTDGYDNLFLIGRNGMHKCKNSDHSTLTAMVAVDNIIGNIHSKENLWSINMEQDYHEQESFVKHEFSEDTQSNLLMNFIFKDPTNKIFAWGSILIIFIQLILFKYWYPFASFINADSYVYLYSAFNNLDIYTYPIGYSKFLRLFSVFTHSDTALVIFQYLLLQFSGLSLIFSLFYFFKPSNITKIVLLSFFILNPANLYLSNYISSDALFFPLSIIWFNLLLFSIYRPTYKTLILLSCMLFISFTVRYNALYYPFVTIIGIILMNRSKILSGVICLVICSILIGKFISFNIEKYNELASTRQFSAFSGWQIANNAMYAYKFVERSNLKKLPTKFQELDNLVRSYFDSTTNNINHPEGKWLAGTIYMWTNSTPLRMYMHMKYGNKEEKDFENWSKISPFYKEYGIELIKSYPLEFFRFYLYPNFLKYYNPPVEFLQNYSTGVDTVAPVAKFWFNYKSSKLNTIFKDYKVNVLNYQPILVGILNSLFLFSLLTSLVMKINAYNKHLRKLTILVVALWLFNLGFSILVSPIALRFQLFPMMIISSYLILYFEKLILILRSPEIGKLDKIIN